MMIRHGLDMSQNFKKQNKNFLTFLHMAQPSFPVDSLSSFYVIRGSQVSVSLRSLQNECHWHSATLWRRTNRLPLWQHPYSDYNSLKLSVQYKIGRGESGNYRREIFEYASGAKTVPRNQANKNRWYKSAVFHCILERKP